MLGMKVSLIITISLFLLSTSVFGSPSHLGTRTTNGRYTHIIARRRTGKGMTRRDGGDYGGDDQPDTDSYQPPESSDYQPIATTQDYSSYAPDTGGVKSADSGDTYDDDQDYQSTGTANNTSTSPSDGEDYSSDDSDYAPDDSDYAPDDSDYAPDDSDYAPDDSDYQPTSTDPDPSTPAADGDDYVS